jgi:hypothetical protein
MPSPEAAPAYAAGKPPIPSEGVRMRAANCLAIPPCEDIFIP